MSCENIWTFCESSWINKDLGLFGQKDPYCNMGVHKGVVSFPKNHANTKK